MFPALGKGGKFMRKIVKGFNIVVSLLLVLIAIGVAFIAFPQFGNQALIVRSGSMAPTIDVGSIVVVSAKQNSPVFKPGDIIAFRSEKNSKTIITHRVVGVEPLKGGDVSYKTKGDKNDTVDGSLVSQKNVLGRVYFTLPFFGKILAFAKTDLGFPLLIIFPAVFVILIEALNIVREIRKKRKKINETFGFVNYDIEKKFNRNLLSLKVLIPLLAFSLFVPGTLAFFSDSETSTENVFQAAEVFPAQVVINEVSSGGNNNSEWVELFNSSSSPIDTTNWTIQDNDSSEIDTLPAGIIPAGGYGVIVGNNTTVSGIPGGVTVITLSDNQIGNGLNNDGDRLTLRDSANNIIDQMNYGNDSTFFTFSSAPTSTQTSARSPNGQDTNTGTDWVIDSSPSIGASN